MTDFDTTTQPILNMAASSNTPHFQLIDYSIFGVMLLISTSIGIYFGYFNQTEQTTEEYLMGGRKMKTIPIAISLVASQLSALTLMAMPPDVYAYGSHYMMMIVPIVTLVTIFVNYVILPVFYENNIDNCYAYLELRFSKSVRNLITVLFFILLLLSLPIFCYIPSLAFAEVSGQNIHLVNAIVTAICALYTMMGGIKAVVWTDVIQASVMVVSIATVLISSVLRVGGMGKIITLGMEGGRLSDPIWKLDLSTRQTVWNLASGMFTIWLAHIGLNQSCVQRMVALPSLGHARRAMAIFCVGVITIIGTNCFLGVIMYVHYQDCDPLKAKKLNKPDQLVPFFVHDIVGHINGMTGLFISSVFSASLSTVSASLNSLAGILYKDYVCLINGFQPTEAKASLIMKSCIAIMGIYCVLFGVMVEKTTSLFQLIHTVAGLTQGAVVGVFTIGLLHPRANHKAVFYAALISMLIVGVIIISGQIYRETHDIAYSKLPTSVEGCDATNTTVGEFESNFKTTPELPTTFMHEVYTMSFQWYGPIGALLVWVVAVPLSRCIGPQDTHWRLDPRLISPLAHGLLPRRSSHIQMHPVAEHKTADETKYTVD